MGYIIGLVIFLVAVPLLFILLTRRSAGVGGLRSRDRGVTVSQPSSDQPTPGASRATDQPAEGMEKRIPPG